jgi:hypothetical protein
MKRTKAMIPAVLSNAVIFLAYLYGLRHLCDVIWYAGTCAVLLLGALFRPEGFTFLDLTQLNLYNLEFYYIEVATGDPAHPLTQEATTWTSNVSWVSYTAGPALMQAKGLFLQAFKPMAYAIAYLSMGQLMRRYKESEFFTKRVAGLFQKMGIALLMAMGLSYMLDGTGSATEVTIALFIVFQGYVMSKAVEMQNDLDGLV